METSSKTQIIVACISVAGVIGAALIAAHSSSPQKDNATQIHQTTNPSDSAAGASNDGTTNTKSQSGTDSQNIQDTSIAPHLNADPDTAVILTAIPSPGSLLPLGQVTDFTVTVRYRLTSRPDAKLAINLQQYVRSPSCVGDTNTPAVQFVPITQGERTVTVTIPYSVGSGKGGGSVGSIGYSGAIWTGADGRELLKDIPMQGYCYAYN